MVLATRRNDYKKIRPVRKIIFKESHILKFFRYDLLITIMEEPCFNFLRTIKTLGYTVFPMLRDTYGIGGLSITVRSQRDKFLVEEVKKCIDEFLLEFKKQLHDMEKDKFEGIKNKRARPHLLTHSSMVGS